MVERPLKLSTLRKGSLFTIPEMATLPTTEEALLDRFGPHLNYPPREGYPGRDEPDKIVETHCCFCGMQCGIKLLVKNNKVVGFERGKSSRTTKAGSVRRVSSATFRIIIPTGCCIRSSEPRAPAFALRIGGMR
jgi:molybdopterin-dependent oxidoreductase iron-sulfur protein